MKYFLPILLVLFTLTSCKDKIIGTWKATGYNCYEKDNLVEEIQVTKNKDTYYAVKITGDNCIPAGDTTWFGKAIDPKIIKGKVYGLNYKTQKKGTEDCEIHFHNDSLHMIIDNEVVIFMSKK